MNIEFLDEKLTKAKLTKGWLTKYTTTITIGPGGYWYYPNGEVFSTILYDSNTIDTARNEVRAELKAAATKSPWERVAPLPKAKAVK